MGGFLCYFIIQQGSSSARFVWCIADLIAQPSTWPSKAKEIRKNHHIRFLSHPGNNIIVECRGSDNNKMKWHGMNKRREREREAKMWKSTRAKTFFQNCQKHKKTAKLPNSISWIRKVFPSSDFPFQRVVWCDDAISTWFSPLENDTQNYYRLHKLFVLALPALTLDRVNFLLYFLRFNEIVHARACLWASKSWKLGHFDFILGRNRIVYKFCELLKLGEIVCSIHCRSSKAKHFDRDESTKKMHIVRALVISSLLFIT